MATCGASTPALAVVGGGIIGGMSAGAAATATTVATSAMIVAAVSAAASVTTDVVEKTYDNLPRNHLEMVPLATGLNAIEAR